MYWSNRTTCCSRCSLSAVALRASRRQATMGGGEGLGFGPGDYFGEMGLLAGKPATANITAVAPSSVYELTKADLKPILEARPEIAQELSRAMAQRLETGRGLTTAELDRTLPTRESSAWFSQHIRRLVQHTITN